VVTGGVTPVDAVVCPASGVVVVPVAPRYHWNADAPVAVGEACRVGLPPEHVRLYEGSRSIQ